MRRLGLACLLCAAALGSARADVPASRIALLAGGRLNFGDLGQRYRYGYMFGAEAGYHWGAIGFNWSILGGAFPSTRSDNPEGELGLLELGLSARARVFVAGDSYRTFLVGQAGGEFLRTSIPVPFDGGGDRQHVGPFVGGGVEVIVADEYMFMLGSHYALLPFEPSGVTVFLSFGVGST